jgi:hypothetical protein
MVNLKEFNEYLSRKYANPGVLYWDGVNYNFIVWSSLSPAAVVHELLSVELSEKQLKKEILKLTSNGN